MSYLTVGTDYESYLENQNITTNIQSKSGTILVTFKKNPPKMKGLDFFSVDIGKQHIGERVSHKAAVLLALAFAECDKNLPGIGGEIRFKSIIDKILPQDDDSEDDSEEPISEEEQYIIDEVLQRSYPSKADIHTIFERDTERTDPRDRKSLSQAIESHFNRPKP